MKRKVFCFLGILCCLVMITGCGNGTPNSTGRNTSTGSNTNTNSGRNNAKSTENLEKNITTQGAVAKNGKLIVLAKNDNSIPVDIEIEVEFYDEKGTIVGSGEEEFQAVGAKSEVAVQIYNTPSSWDNYKIYADADTTDEISYIDKLDIKHSDNQENIAVQVTNNSDDKIEYITVAVVYYQGEEVVGINDGIESDIKPGRSANFNIYYPADSNYNDVSFDSYKVFVNEAYSYGW